MTLNQRKPIIVYLGTPEFAISCLSSLFHSGDYEIAAVITQTDKPAGRGKKLKSPPVYQAAKELGLNIFQPKTLKSLSVSKNKDGFTISGEKSCEELASFLNGLPKIDAYIVVAYGKLIPSYLFPTANHGFLNIHPSLLPRWRGAAPVQHTIFAGDKETGTTLMLIDEGLDSGPIYCSQKIPVEASDNYGTLTSKLAEASATLLIDKLPEILSGRLQSKPQGESGITYAEKWEGSDMQINWGEPAERIARRIRASSPYAGARTHLNDKLIKIFEGEAVFPSGTNAKANDGEVLIVDKNELIVACGESSYIALKELQLEGKKRLPIAEIIRGHQLKVGDLFH